MYCGEMDSKFLSLAEKLDLHPSILAPLSGSSSILQTYVPIGPMDSNEDTSL